MPLRKGIPGARGGCDKADKVSEPEAEVAGGAEQFWELV